MVISPSDGLGSLVHHAHDTAAVKLPTWRSSINIYLYIYIKKNTREKCKNSKRKELCTCTSLLPNMTLSAHLLYRGGAYSEIVIGTKYVVPTCSARSLCSKYNSLFFVLDVIIQTFLIFRDRLVWVLGPWSLVGSDYSIPSW